MRRSTFVTRALEHLPSLLRAGRRWSGTDHEAEDLAQETLIRALQKQDELRDVDRMKGWLLAIQRTTFLNGRRGLGPKLEVLAGGRSAPVEPVGDLEAEVMGRSLDDRLLRALESLPEDWREALWLREVDELSYEEVGRVQGCPVGTVRSRLARGRARLLELLQEVKRHADV